MVKIVNLIVSDIVNEVKADKNLSSLSLVGSFSNPDKELESSNDLDFVFIYEKLGKESLDSLKKLAVDLRKKYSSEKVEINYTFKIGPIKLSSNKLQSILIHFLVYSKENYFKYESVLTRYSFQHYPQLLGLPLKEVNNFKSVVDIDLFNDIDGIPAIKKWIHEGAIPYIEPTFKGVKISNIKLKNEVYLEVIFYSILWLSNNLLRVFGEFHPDIDSDMCMKFKQKIPIKLNNFPLQVYKYKKLIRNNKTLSDENIEDLKKNALRFVEECESYLRDKL